MATTDEPIVVDSSSGATNFFSESLRAAMLPEQRRIISREERLYSASALTFFAWNPSTRLTADGHNPGLREVLDEFIFRRAVPTDPLLREILGIYILVLTGFYRRQSGRRHNLTLYTAYGSHLFESASNSVELFGRRELLLSTSKKFVLWQEVFQQLHDHFFWERFVIPTHKPGPKPS